MDVGQRQSKQQAAEDDGSAEGQRREPVRGPRGGRGGRTGRTGSAGPHKDTKAGMSVLLGVAVSEKHSPFGNTVYKIVSYFAVVFS